MKIMFESVLKILLPMKQLHLKIISIQFSFGGNELISHLLLFQPEVSSFHAMTAADFLHQQNILTVCWYSFLISTKYKQG